MTHNDKKQIFFQILVNITILTDILKRISLHDCFMFV